jgi:acyl-homoserine lactone acylase PvdQ
MDGLLLSQNKNHYYPTNKKTEIFHKMKSTLLQIKTLKSLILLFLIPIGVMAQTFYDEEIKLWKQHVKLVRIIRDNWGVPHIYGKTDANSVFGLMYSQCEDNYWQLEETFIS